MCHLTPYVRCPSCCRRCLKWCSCYKCGASAAVCNSCVTVVGCQGGLVVVGRVACSLGTHSQHERFHMFSREFRFVLPIAVLVALVVCLVLA